MRRPHDGPVTRNSLPAVLEPALPMPFADRPAAEDSPFFLVGPLRSGTTVLRLLLGHHPRICRCDEMEYVASAIAGRLDWPDVASYVARLPERFDFRSSGFVPDSSLSFVELVNDFFAQRRAADGRELVGATVHNEFDQLVRVWPEARFIRLDRDPRDVARSCVAMGWAGNAWAGAEYWLRADAAWRRLRRAVPEERRLEVRFDELMNEPVAALTRITAFLGVGFDPAMLDIERDTTYRRPDRRQARSWRDDAADDDVRQVEARLGPRMAAAGYAPSGLPLLPLSPLREVSLRLGHRIGRMQASRRRYGLRLWSTHVLGRKLAWLPAFGEARRRARSAMAAIDEMHLK